MNIYFSYFSMTGVLDLKNGCRASVNILFQCTVVTPAALHALEQRRLLLAMALESETKKTVIKQ